MDVTGRVEPSPTIGSDSPVPGIGRVGIVLCAQAWRAVGQKALAAIDSRKRRRVAEFIVPDRQCAG
jgi:hypothetical protein